QAYYDAALQRHSQKILEYQAAIKATTQAQNGFFGARNLNSFNLMSLGHIVDDLQYINGPMGIQPVLNNIMMLAPALGIVSVAAFQLYRNWDKLFGDEGARKVDLTRTAVERLGKTLEELDKKELKTASDRFAIRRLEEQQRDTNAARRVAEGFDRIQTTGERSAGSSLDAILARIGGDDALVNVRDAMVRDAPMNDPVVRDLLE